MGGVAGGGVVFGGILVIKLKHGGSSLHSNGVRFICSQLRSFPLKCLIIIEFYVRQEEKLSLSKSESKKEKPKAEALAAVPSCHRT